MQTRRATVVIPIHNEAANIEPMVTRLHAVAAALAGWTLEILFVDDGSTDATPRMLEELRARGLPLGCLRFSRNFGHQAALEAGLLAATGDVVISLDGDLQHPPECLPDMLRAHEQGAEVVQMIRHQPATGSKGGLSRMFYACFNALSSTEIIPDASDFRLVSRRVVEVVRQIPEREKFLRALIPSLGFQQVTLNYEEARRTQGQPSYTLLKSARLARKALFDYSTLPLRLTFWLGSALALLSFLFGVGHVILKLIAWQHIQPGFTDIITAVLFLSGCLLAAVGILGRYLLIVIEHVRGRPAYIVMDRREPGPLPARPGSLSHPE